MCTKNDNPLKTFCNVNFTSCNCHHLHFAIAICKYLHHLKSSFMKLPVTTLYTTAGAAVADSNTLCGAAGRQVSRAGPGSWQGPCHAS